MVHKPKPVPFLRTVVLWTLAAGLFGTALGVITITLEPDTGHIPKRLVPVMMGVPGAIVGFVSGLLFASVVASSRLYGTPGSQARSLFGGFVGMCIGILLVHLATLGSLIALVLGACVGGALGFRWGSRIGQVS